MLPSSEYGSGETTLIMMPFLGGSQREWTETVEILKDTYRCITLDLPGFGAAAAITGYAVSEMTDAVIDALVSLNLVRYILVGHSMAGKLTAVLSRRLIDSHEHLAPPDGLVLVAPSPPGPEPMSDPKREEMLNSLGRDSQIRRGGYSEDDRSAAEKFVRGNLAQPISDLAFNRTVDEVLLMNPAAWTAWLTSGSKEDWASFVGVIDLPTLIVAGKRDQALGPNSQRVHTAPHFGSAQLSELECSHLIPLERPAELAALISVFAESMQNGAAL